MRSAECRERPAGGRAWSQAQPASRTRPSGRCSAGPGSPGRRGRARGPANRYEWPCPGDLLHMDTSEYARFQRPGHRVTGDRRSQDRQHRDGSDIVHAIVDDHSRLAYAEIHDDQRAATVVGFLERALAFYEQHGVKAKRLMTDNAWQYARSRDLRRLLERHRIQHLKTRALPAAHQRQGRALPPDDGPRVGIRARLQLTPRPRRGSATLAQPLQHAATAQLTRRPAPDQPLSQRPWAGHLDGEGGIRTLDGGLYPHNALAGRRLQPLGHFSGPGQDSPGCRLPFSLPGGVAERSNAAVSKTVSGGFVRRGFKSLPLRLTSRNPPFEAGFGVLPALRAFRAGAAPAREASCSSGAPS